MAINKELYERYKAMKAAKLAAMEANTNDSEQTTTYAQTQSTPKLVSGFSALNQHSEQSYLNEPQNPGQNQYKSQSYINNDSLNNVNYVSENHSNVSFGASHSEQVDNNTEQKNVYSGNVIQSVSNSNYNSQFSVNFSDDYIKQPKSAIITDIQNNEIKANSQEPVIKKFALLGYPLGHSLSNYIHSAGFKSLGVDATYEIIETPPDELVDRIKYLKTHKYSGFNVTIPLKLPVSMFMDEIDKSANIVNAINTVMIDSSTGALKGYNTDAAGFYNSIPKDVSLYNKTAGILGTGGAARAAIVALAQLGVSQIRLYSRHIPNCVGLLDYLRKTFAKIEFNVYQIDMIKDLSEIDILVNATPIGMQGHAADYTPVEEPELQTLPAHALVYDVIYNPKKTLLLRLAQKHNYRIINGMDMLIYQAVESEKIWFGGTPDFKDMKIAALENM